MEAPASFSTPIKRNVIQSHASHSVDDLLEAINHNLSTSSLRLDGTADNEHNNTLLLNTSDDNPITPLKFKPHARGKVHSLPGSPVKEEAVIQDIPPAPSFDELEFNTRLNRQSSLSKVGGPRQLSKSLSFKSSGFSSRDNSPSKRSVCFDDSPPKIVEYNELTPEHSDESFEEGAEEKLQSPWEGRIKQHALPPPPPKHQVVASPPQKDTTLGSSDEDNSKDFNLTREDLTNNSITLEQRLDLVLGSDEVSRKVQADEVKRGSGSPLRPVAKEEEAFVLNIKSKAELAEEKSMRDVSELFEMDLKNNDKEVSILRLDPVLKRRASNSSLKDEERTLATAVISKESSSIVLGNGLKDADVQNLQTSMDVVSVAESQETFESATDVFESEEILIPQPNLPTQESRGSICTLEQPGNSGHKTHKKKLSLSESISSFISSLSMSPKKSPVKLELEDISLPSEDLKKSPVKVEEEAHIPGDLPLSSWHDSVLSPSNVSSDRASVPAESAKKEVSSEDSFTYTPSTLVTEEISRREYVELTQSLVVAAEAAETGKLLSPRPSESSLSPIGDAMHVDISEEQALLDDASPSQVVLDHTDRSLDEFVMRPPLLVEMDNSSFSEEFKEIGLYNTSDKMDESYRSNNLTAQDINVVDCEEDELLEELSHSDVLSQGSHSRNELPSPVESLSIVTERTLPLIAIEQRAFEVQFKSAEPSPSTLASPLDEYSSASEVSRSLQIPRSEGAAQPIELKEVAVQTDQSFHSLKPSLPNEKKNTRTALPSFDSMLFHDKLPSDDDAVSSPPTSFIEIWHNQPKKVLPNPQYSLHGRVLSPPTNLLKVLSTRRSGPDYFDDTTMEDSVIKRESLSRRASLDLATSFVTRSFSKSSYINVDSKRSSAIVESSFTGDANPDLLDISQSSDFGVAFKDWNVSTMSDVEAKMNQLSKTNDATKAIWDTHNSHGTAGSARVISHAADKIGVLIAGSTTDNAQVCSTQAAGEVVVTKNEDEDLGLAIEFDHDWDHDITDYKMKQKDILPKPLDAFPVANPTVIKSSSDGVMRADDPIAIPTMEQKDNRLISDSTDASGFDLNDEFDRAVQLQDQTYVAHQRQEMIIAKTKTNDMAALEEQEQGFTDRAGSRLLPQNSMQTTKTGLDYGKTRAKMHVSPQVPRVRTPLGAMAGNDINQLSQGTPSGLAAVSNTFPDNIKMKKRGSRMSMKSAEPKLPVDDKGRLYIHINSLNDVRLDRIKNHKATFKLYLDNGKHTVSIPKMDLSNEVPIDKEFELAIEDDTTELFFTSKLSYNKLENELVDVYERIPLSKNRLGRLFGIKPKYRVEKRYETRKKTSDEWDSKFALDGSFAKNKITFYAKDNQITAKTQDYSIELFNEWETQVQNGKEYKKTPYLIAKLDVTMLYLPRSSPLETLPPSIKIAQGVAQHIVEQSKIRYEGYLFQEGGDCELWKRRFFTIEDTKMIARTEDTKKPRAQINLLKVVEVTYTGKKRAANQRNVTDDILMSDGFKLRFKNGEIINFNGETSESKVGWIKVLETVVELNKLHQPWVKMLADNSA